VELYGEENVEEKYVDFIHFNIALCFG
jgi:hypothetical protein